MIPLTSSYDGPPIDVPAIMSIFIPQTQKIRYTALRTFRRATSCGRVEAQRFSRIPTVCDKSGCEASIGCVGGTYGCDSGPSNSTSSITPATNEHDYKAGFSLGFSNYHCAASEADCDPVTSNENVILCTTDATPGKYHFGETITNITACLDGYMDGWKHWCKTDAKHCAMYIKYGIFPGSRVNTTAGISSAPISDTG